MVSAILARSALPALRAAPRAAVPAQARGIHFENKVHKVRACFRCHRARAAKLLRAPGPECAVCAVYRHWDSAVASIPRSSLMNAVYCTVCEPVAIGYRFADDNSSIQLQTLPWPTGPKHKVGVAIGTFAFFTTAAALPIVAVTFQKLKA